MRILGIDCGSRITGYGVIEAKGRERRSVGYGAIRLPAERDLAERLLSLAESLEEVLRRFEPEEVAIEDVFAKRNIRSAFVLASVRGAAMLTAARAGLKVASYTPSQVKSSVAGYGNAGKKEVRQMVGVLLGVREAVKPLDISDALAVAYCHANLRHVIERG